MILCIEIKIMYYHLLIKYLGLDYLTLLFNVT